LAKELVEVIQPKVAFAFLVPLVRILSASSFAAKFNLGDFHLQQFKLGAVHGYQEPS
jgi:hypothetical protein